MNISAASSATCSAKRSRTANCPMTSPGPARSSRISATTMPVIISTGKRSANLQNLRLPYEPGTLLWGTFIAAFATAWRRVDPAAQHARVYWRCGVECRYSLVELEGAGKLLHRPAGSLPFRRDRGGRAAERHRHGKDINLWPAHRHVLPAPGCRPEKRRRDLRSRLFLFLGAEGGPGY